jgi:hypothetical protein
MNLGFSRVATISRESSLAEANVAEADAGAKAAALFDTSAAAGAVRTCLVAAIRASTARRARSLTSSWLIAAGTADLVFCSESETIPQHAQRAMQPAHSQPPATAATLHETLFSSYLALGQFELAMLVFKQLAGSDQHKPDPRARLVRCLEQLAAHAKPPYFAASNVAPSTAHLAWLAASALSETRLSDQLPAAAHLVVPSWSLAASEMILELGLDLPPATLDAHAADLPSTEAARLANVLTQADHVVLAMLTHPRAELARFVWHPLQFGPMAQTWLDLTALAIAVLVERGRTRDAGMLFALAPPDLAPPSSLVRAAGSDPPPVAEALLTSPHARVKTQQVFGAISPDPWTNCLLAACKAYHHGAHWIEALLLCSPRGPAVLANVPQHVLALPRSFRVAALFAEAPSEEWCVAVEQLAREAVQLPLLAPRHALEVQLDERLCDSALHIRFCKALGPDSTHALVDTVVRVMRDGLWCLFLGLMGDLQHDPWGGLSSACLQDVASCHDVQLELRACADVQRELASVRQAVSVVLLRRHQFDAAASALACLPGALKAQTCHFAVRHVLPLSVDVARCLSVLDARGDDDACVARARARWLAAPALGLDQALALTAPAEHLQALALDLARPDVAAALGYMAPPSEEAFAFVDDAVMQGRALQTFPGASPVAVRALERFMSSSSADADAKPLVAEDAAWSRPPVPLSEDAISGGGPESLQALVRAHHGRLATKFLAHVERVGLATHQTVDQVLHGELEQSLRHALATLADPTELEQVLEQCACNGFDPRRLSVGIPRAMELAERRMPLQGLTRGGPVLAHITCLELAQSSGAAAPACAHDFPMLAALPRRHAAPPSPEHVLEAAANEEAAAAEEAVAPLDECFPSTLAGYLSAQGAVVATCQARSALAQAQYRTAIDVAFPGRARDALTRPASLRPLKLAVEFLEDFSRDMGAAARSQAAVDLASQCCVADGEFLNIGLALRALRAGASKDAQRQFCSDTMDLLKHRAAEPSAEWCRGLYARAQARLQARYLEVT